MTYPASPNDARANRVRPDAAQYWAGAVATAVVAALIALVGILISRWLLTIPILAPAGDGAWGNASTGVYVLVAALVAIVAAGVLYLLVLGTPQPGMFFDWIMGLATLAAVVYPFSTGAPVNQKGATAVVNLVLGIAITSLLTGVAARAIRRPVPPAYRDGYGPADPYGPAEGYGPDGPYAREDQYGPMEGYRNRQRYPGQRPPEQGNVPQQREDRPTQPINTPRGRNYRR